jgi:hypothetical protein
VSIGKATEGYQNYISSVPKSKRNKKHPRTPDSKGNFSKRQWDNRIRKWRRRLHEFDDEEASSKVEKSLPLVKQQSAPLPNMEWNQLVGGM